VENKELDEVVIMSHGASSKFAEPNDVVGGRKQPEAKRRDFEVVSSGCRRLGWREAQVRIRAARDLLVHRLAKYQIFFLAGLARCGSGGRHAAPQEARWARGRRVVWP
jgi:hypothetical protein